MNQIKKSKYKFDTEFCTLPNWSLIIGQFSIKFEGRIKIGFSLKKYNIDLNEKQIFAKNYLKNWIYIFTRQALLKIL